MRLAIAIMAAGKGTRLKSKRPKVLHEIGGKPLLAHVIAAAAQLVSPQDIFVIVGHEAEKVKAAVAATGVQFVLQPEQRGTGHAIQCAREQVKGYDTLLVLSGDAPLIRPETITRMRDFHFAQLAAMTILTAIPADPFGYGRVIRSGADSPEVTAIVEQKALTPEQAKAPEINSGIYAFTTAPLFEHIDSLATNNAHSELYLTDMAGLLVAAKHRVVAIKSEDPNEVLGANTIAEMMDLDATMRAKKARELMAVGVTIFRPETVTIDADVSVGADTIIEPFVQLLGKTRIGEDCRIRSHSVIENSTLENNVLIRNGSLLTEASIGTGSFIGPYSHIRPGSEIGEGAHIGNFVETKKIKMGKGSKANHLTYLGDATIGSGTNIGAGTITCNYDGVDKHMTIIGNDVFIGSDSTLVAPVTLGDGSFIGAGSCVTDDVPPDALAIGRGRPSGQTGLGQNQRPQMQNKKLRIALDFSRLSIIIQAIKVYLDSLYVVQDTNMNRLNHLYRATSLLLSVCVLASTMPAIAQSGSLNCSSNDGGYRYCRANTQNRVILTRQLSGSPCQQGYSWGYDYRGIWVDRGCRAQFQFGNDNNNNNGGNGNNTGAAVAAGILGAIVIGSIIASQNNNDNDDNHYNHDQQRRDYYRDGYRSGQRDWDDDLDPYYPRYRNRFPPQFQNDFAAGYDDGYNNRPNRYR